MSDFTLHISLGDDGMQTGTEVAEALRGVADRVLGVSNWGPLDGSHEGTIRDLNGNTVGNWTVTQ